MRLGWQLELTCFVVRCCWAWIIAATHGRSSGEGGGVLPGASKPPQGIIADVWLLAPSKHWTLTYVVVDADLLSSHLPSSSPSWHPNTLCISYHELMPMRPMSNPEHHTCFHSRRLSSTAATDKVSFIHVCRTYILSSHSPRKMALLGVTPPPWLTDNVLGKNHIQRSLVSALFHHPLLPWLTTTNSITNVSTCPEPTPPSNMSTTIVNGKHLALSPIINLPQPTALPDPNLSPTHQHSYCGGKQTGCKWRVFGGREVFSLVMIFNYITVLGVNPIITLVSCQKPRTVDWGTLE